MNAITSPSVLKLHWEAAKRFFAKMQLAYECGDVSFAAMDAADIAECTAYNAWQAA